MKTCDVLIVGGGPAGSSCAWGLHRAGANVLVLDKKTFPRDKTCAGWVTPPVLEALQFDADDYRRQHVFQPITGFRTGIIGGEELETDYKQTVSYGIRRCEFDHYLLRRTGVPCRLGEPLRSLERNGNKWIVNEEIEAAVVVGAGGHFCPISRQLGGRSQPGASVVTAQEVEFEATEADLANGRISGNVPELFFCNDLQGYGWCFRKGNYLNIGLGRLSSENLPRHVAQFCDFLRERGKVTASIPERFHGHAYQLYERVSPKLCDDGIVLIGDAAGLAYPQSGEGIRPAVESGLIAADVLTAARGDYSAEHLQPYAQKVRARFGAPRNRGAADWLPAGWIRFLAANLLSSRWFARKVVLDRWFLHSDVRPLQTAIS